MKKVYKAISKISFPLCNKEGEFVQRVTFEEDGFTLTTRDKGLIALLDLNAKETDFFKCIEEEADEEDSDPSDEVGSEVEEDATDGTNEEVSDKEGSEVVDGITSFNEVKEYLQFKRGVDPANLTSKKKVQEVVKELGIVFSGFSF